MSFKFLSGDFLSEYNRLLLEYKAKQSDLDAEFDRKISLISDREKSRLEQMHPSNIEPGTLVKTFDGKVGVVTESQLEFVTKRGGMNEWETLLTGPERYWPVRDEIDETIITCEGYMRSYNVVFEPHALELDWGIQQNTITMFEDEFEVVNAQELR